jgi:hypothetical protein
MTRIAAACAVPAVLLALCGTAQADSATAYVGSVMGLGAFEVQGSGSQLYFHPQPDSDYVWIKNNGSPPGTVLTYDYGGVTYNRDGMKTFAAADVAYGQTIDSIKLEFDYFTGADPITGINIVYYPTINVLLTDGSGNYGIWSATSGGTAFQTAPIVEEPGWSHLTLDCRSLSDSTWGQMNEYNGGLATNRPYWSVIQDWTIAGFYDYQQAPQGGFEAWNQTLWSDITNIADPGDTTLNQYGITLSWGDTVGGCYEDGSGEIGAAANRPYGQAGRMVKDYQITVGETVYNMTFEAGVVPEPGTALLMVCAAVGMLVLRRRQG